MKILWPLQQLLIPLTLPPTPPNLPSNHLSSDLTRDQMAVILEDAAKAAGFGSIEELSDFYKKDTDAKKGVHIKQSSGYYAGVGYTLPGNISLGVYQRLGTALAPFVSFAMTFKANENPLTNALMDSLYTQVGKTLQAEKNASRRRRKHQLLF